MNNSKRNINFKGKKVYLTHPTATTSCKYYNIIDVRYAYMSYAEFVILNDNNRRISILKSRFDLNKVIK